MGGIMLMIWGEFVLFAQHMPKSPPFSAIMHVYVCIIQAYIDSEIRLATLSIADFQLLRFFIRIK